jgi:Icc-related predicted phosphoesterase
VAATPPVTLIAVHGGEDGRQPLKLLALADEPPRVDPATLVASNAAGAVVTLGDLEPEWLWSLDRVKLPKIGVHGNHDDDGTLATLGVEDVHLRRMEIGDWSFAGFAGCVRYGRGPYQFTQRQAAKLAKHLPAADVLVCHCPPRGVNDEPDDVAHLGFEALRAWVERHRPRYILHGHTTPDPRTRTNRFAGAQVVWVRGSRIVELRERDE